MVDLGHHVRRKVENCGVAKIDLVKEFVNRNMSVAIVQDEKHFPVGHATVKVLQPFQKNDLRHPCFDVVLILASEICAVDIFEASGIGVLADYPERKLVCVVTIAVDNHNDPLLVLLTAFELQGSCCLPFANASTLDNEDLKGLGFGT